MSTTTPQSARWYEPPDEHDPDEPEELDWYDFFDPEDEIDRKADYYASLYEMGD